MLEKLRNNQSLTSIAKEYGVDHSTISYHKQKHGIEGMANSGRPKLPPKPPKTPKPKAEKAKPIVYVRDRKFYPLEDVLLGDKINVGKSYAEYVEEDRKRREKLSPPKG
jgi:hypothetical protein